VRQTLITTPPPIVALPLTRCTFDDEHSRLTLTASVTFPLFRQFDRFLAPNDLDIPTADDSAARDDTSCDELRWMVQCAAPAEPDAAATPASHTSAPVCLVPRLHRALLVPVPLVNR
jgi:hypothetical protein